MVIPRQRPAQQPISAVAETDGRASLTAAAVLSEARHHRLGMVPPNPLEAGMVLTVSSAPLGNGTGGPTRVAEPTVGGR